jgi:hypothetical protein
MGKHVIHKYLRVCKYLRIVKQISGRRQEEEEEEGVWNFELMKELSLLLKQLSDGSTGEVTGLL